MDQQTPIVGYHGEIRWRLLSPAFESLCHCGLLQHQVGSNLLQHQVGSNLLQHQVGSKSPGHSLLNLALLFLLVTAPDFGTFDPVLVSLHPLPSWCSQRQSGQKTKLHFEELH